MNREQLEAARAALIRRGAYRHALQLGALAFGGGAALRGLSGLAGTLSRNLRPARRPSLLAPAVVEVPVHEEEEEAPAKEAGFLEGGKNTTPEGWWAAMPLAVGSAGLGAVGGWTLADKLLDRRRKKQLEAELEKAKKEYEEALRGESKLGRQLDTLYETLEKRGVNAADYAGRALGVLAVLGLLSGGTGAYIGYQATRKRNPYKIKEKVKKQLRMQRALRRPAPIFAQPIHTEDSLENEELKAAAAPPPPPPQTPKPPKGPSVPPSAPRPR